MPDFKIQFEWEDAPRVRAPELDATWARLEIHAGGDAITKVEISRIESVRPYIYVPLFPVAEWVVANWWFLWDEWRADGRNPRHNLLAAREGFVLPDLSFLPTETRMELAWRPVSSPAASAAFLSGGSKVVDKSAVKEEFRRLVDAVVERLERRHVQGSYLAVEWRAIQEAERDPEQKAFCERAARLGCDPFDVEESVATQIEHLGVVLPEPMVEDFCDAIPLAQLASGAGAIRAFIDSALLATPEEGRWREVRERLRSCGEEIPWRDGYNEARALRSYLGLNGPIAAGLDSFLSGALGSFEVKEFAAPSRIDAVSAPAQTHAPVFGFPPGLGEGQRRFSLCRALCDHLVSGQPSLVTRSRTEHQQRNRAFAAEFLAPADSIRERIGGDRVAEEDIEELAREFEVSDLVIRHQIQNHNLAWLGA